MYTIGGEFDGVDCQYLLGARRALARRRRARYRDAALAVLRWPHDERRERGGVNRQSWHVKVHARRRRARQRRRRGRQRRR